MRAVGALLETGHRRTEGHCVPRHPISHLTLPHGASRADPHPGATVADREDCGEATPEQQDSRWERSAEEVHALRRSVAQGVLEALPTGQVMGWKGGISQSFGDTSSHLGRPVTPREHRHIGHLTRAGHRDLEAQGL